MDAVLGIAVGLSTVRVALIEGTRADGDIIDEVMLDMPAPRRADSGAAQVIDTIVGTQRSLAGAGHRLVAAGICVLGGFATLALREALQHHGVDDFVMISEAEADEALSNRGALNDPHREVAAARGAALAAPRAMNAGPPTIFRSALARPVGPTHVAPIAQADLAPTHYGPIANPPTGPFAANTQLATTPPPPAPAAAPLAYSMTGNMGTLTDPVEQFESGPHDYYQALSPTDIDPYAFDPDLDNAPEQAPEQPARKSFLLAGSLATVFVAVAIAILATTVVVSVTPTAEQKPITSSQQPILTPLATRVGERPVVVPASAPVQPPPAPPAPPAPPVVQAPPRVTQAPQRVNQAPQRVNQAPPRNRYTPPPAHDDEGQPPVSPPPNDDNEAPPPRFTPFGPPPNSDGGPPGRSRFSPHIGGIPPSRGPGCIPLLPC